MNPDVTEAGFWAAWLRNRTIDVRTAADGAVAIAGGYALCAAGTALAATIGAGTSRPLVPDDLATVRSFFARRALPPVLDLDEAVLARDRETVASAGFAEDGARQAVLAGEPAPAGRAEGEAAIGVRQAADRRAWIALALAASADGGGDGAQREATAALWAAAAHALFTATLDGREVGVAAVGIRQDAAVLIAAAVLPSARRRGVYGALVAERLRWARTRGAGAAVAAIPPDGAAERALRRAGLLRAHLRVRMIAR